MKAANMSRSQAQCGLALPRCSRSSAVAHTLWGACPLVCHSIALMYSHCSSLMFACSRPCFSRNRKLDSSALAAEPPLCLWAIWHRLDCIAWYSGVAGFCPSSVPLMAERYVVRVGTASARTLIAMGSANHSFAAALAMIAWAFHASPTVFVVCVGRDNQFSRS